MRFGEAAHVPGLPEVAALVGGDGVESGGEAEVESSDEGVAEADPGEIDVSKGAEEGADGILRRNEGCQSLGERARVERADYAGRPRLELHGRFKAAHEETSDESGCSGSATEASELACVERYRFHGTEIDAVGAGEMFEAFGDAPRARLRAPAAALLAETGGNGLRVAKGCVVLVVECLEIGEHVCPSRNSVVLRPA